MRSRTYVAIGEIAALAVDEPARNVVRLDGRVDAEILRPHRHRERTQRDHAEDVALAFRLRIVVLVAFERLPHRLVERRAVARERVPCQLDTWPRHVEDPVLERWIARVRIGGL